MVLHVPARRAEQRSVFRRLTSRNGERRFAIPPYIFVARWAVSLSRDFARTLRCPHSGCAGFVKSVPGITRKRPFSAPNIGWRRSRRADLLPASWRAPAIRVRWSCSGPSERNAEATRRHSAPTAARRARRARFAAAVSLLVVGGEFKHVQ
jgi:hypothetical protein